MAKFKISLITSINGDKNINSTKDQSTFIPTVISNYNSQIKFNDNNAILARANPEDSFSYTYNEKLSIHQNAQKELSFDMDRKLLLHDEWLDNPYVSAIHIGSTIELQDKYDNTYLFIVNKINYKFKEHNIIYQYTCQDAFSYQYTRQQSGYTIENDSTSENFIGPKTIDWWVIQKIIPECYIQYNYIPLSIGLYALKTADKYQVFTFTTEERLSWKDIDGEEKIILKEPYSDAELFTPIIFSCSNSNANAALIALGEELNLMIHTYEHIDNNQQYYRYFWYEPKQNQDVSGLTYSPKKNIKDFGLNFKGDSLTTVLNINSNELGEDIVTLFPSIPDFFTTLFSSEEWKTTRFYPGYFSDIIDGKYYSYSTNLNNNNSIVIGDNIEIKQFGPNNYICLPLCNSNNTKLQFNSLYDYFSDNWKDDQLTVLIFQIAQQAYTFNGKNTISCLIIEFTDKSTHTMIIKENEKIPLDLIINKNYTISLGIKTSYPVGSSISLFSGSLYFKFYRLFSEEEKEFAYIADNCPWLENRLIDFSYFYQQGIISTNEYTKLMDILINNLRIINGRLMYLTNNYYQLLKDKVKTISNLQTEADRLGSQFEADIVNPITRGTDIKSIQNFKSAYNEVFKIENYNSKPIIDYNDLLGEYCEKYIDSEQSFLKNCYEFRKYFNEPFKNNFDSIDGLYKYTLTINMDNINSKNAEDHFISFNQPTFRQITSEDINQTIFHYTDGNYQLSEIVNNINKTNYYVPSIKANEFIEVAVKKDESNNIIIDDSIYDYSENNKYFISQADYKKYFHSFIEQQEDILKDKETHIHNGTTYYQLNSDELRRLIIAAHYTDYYIRDPNTYTQFISTTDSQTDVRINNKKEFLELFNFESLPDIMKYIDPYYKIKANNNKNDDTEEQNFMWEYYKAFFPVDTIYYYGPNIRIYSKTDDKTNITTYYLETLNEFNKVDKTSNYKKFQPITFANDGAMLSNWGSCGTDAAEIKKEAIKNNWKYLSYRYAGDNNVYWFGLLSRGYVIIRGIIDLVGKNGGNVGFLSRYKLQSNREAQRSIEGKTYNDSHHRYDSPLVNYVLNDQNENDIPLYRIFIDLMIERLNESLINNNTTTIYLTDNIKLDISNFNLNNIIKYDDKYVKNYYWNLYKYIVATYSFRHSIDDQNWNDDRAIELNNLFVKNSYFQILGLNSRINKQEKYVIIPITQKYGNAEEDHLIQDKNIFKYFNKTFEQDKVYSALKYYNLIHLSQPLDTQNTLLWKDNNVSTIPLQKVLDMIKSTNNITIEGDGPLFTFTDNNKNIMTAYIAKLYDYNKVPFNVNDLFPIDTPDGQTVLDQHNFKFLDNSSLEELKWGSVYDCHIDVLINPLKRNKALNFTSSIYEPLRTLKLYTISNVDSNMQPIQESQDNLDTQFIYKKTKDKDNTYIRVYTFNQLINAKEKDTNYCTNKTYHQYFVLKGSSEEYELLTNNVSTFSPTLYLCTVKRNKKDDSDDTIISFSSVKYDQPQDIVFKYHIEGNNETIYDNLVLNLVDSNGIHYTNTISLKKEQLESFNNITNGMFWYRFNNRLDNQTLFNEAANIATQLQTYWDQAYLASKYCKYFLPKSWIASSEQNPNAFFNNIIIPQYTTTDNISKLTGVIVSDKYIPQVEIYMTITNNVLKYKHYLPRYMWHYNPSNSDSNMNKLSMDQYSINQQVIAQQQNSNYIKADKIDLINHNKGLIDIMDTLNTKLSDWEVLKNGYTVYYYKVGGGTLWSKMAQDYLLTSDYDKMTGTYGVIFYKLKNVYKNNPVTEYTKVKEEKERIWNNIYLNYPYLMLEENYSYNLATSSTELYKMAQLIFKGKKEPEKDYSLSVIDYYSLINYHGEELKPGYGIQIDANKYYDENDDIYKALSQYLFITDISYTLRKDDDLNITINNIKYQEKLLQSLVKLIR